MTHAHRVIWTLGSYALMVGGLLLVGWRARGLAARRQSRRRAST